MNADGNENGLKLFYNHRSFDITVFTRISATVLIKIFMSQMRCLFEAALILKLGATKNCFFSVTDIILFYDRNVFWF